jgi:hypothetical protein
MVSTCEEAMSLPFSESNAEAILVAPISMPITNVSEDDIRLYK